MKKFNILALAALAMALVGDVNAVQFGTINSTIPTNAIVTAKQQLALAKQAKSVSGNNLLSSIVSKGTPANALAVGAASSLTANTKGGTKARFNSTGFQAGAQVTNEQTSQAQGGLNAMGQNIATSQSLDSQMLTGSNLQNILTKTSAQAPTSAISTLTANTSNKGTVSFGNSSQGAASRPSNAQTVAGSTGDPVTGIAGTNPAAGPVAGTFGNVSSKMMTSTAGSSNTLGGSIGSNNRYAFSGNFGPNS